jgi:hypothetical protein|tara:strand:- start:560 stop:1387 length:828 start_codon:yes stop_codon:yes gene_type:complete
MKLRHNKKRNTAFLYEALVKELTKAIVNKDIEKKNVLVSMLKENFSTGRVLQKELELIKVLSETKETDLYTAERLLKESVKRYTALSQDEIFEAQSMLIESINKNLSKEVYGNFVPNYKHLATIWQMFTQNTSVKEKVLLERTLISAMISKGKETIKSKQMPHVDKLVFKTVIENFNKSYDGELLAEQKELLNNYIISFGANEVEFKVYLNEELGRLKNEVTTLKEKEVMLENKDLAGKLEDVRATLDKFQTKKINPAMLEKVMQVQKLVKECAE